MKNRVLTFIIGVLVGAIVATIGVYCYAKNANLMSRQMPEMMNRENGEEPPERPDGEGEGRGLEGEKPPSGNENLVAE